MYRKLINLCEDFSFFWINRGELDKFLSQKHGALIRVGVLFKDCLME